MQKYQVSCNSWVVVDKDTGAAVLETYSQKIADAINRERYSVHTALEYLQNLNAKIHNSLQSPAK